MATTTVPCTMEPLTVVAARQQDLRLVAAREQRASSVAMEHNKLASSPGAMDFHTSESVSLAPLRGACWSVGKVGGGTVTLSEERESSLSCIKLAFSSWFLVRQITIFLF